MLQSPRPSDSESSDSPSDSEVPPTLTPPAGALHLLKSKQQVTAQHLAPLRHRMHPGMATLESVTSMASLAAVAALTGGPQAAQVPFGYQPLFAGAPNWYLNSLARNLQQQCEQRMDVDKPAGAPGAPGGGDLPLDLSSKPGNSTASNVNNTHSVSTIPTSNSINPLDNKIPANIRLPALDTKHIFK